MEDFISNKEVIINRNILHKPQTKRNEVQHDTIRSKQLLHGFNTFQHKKQHNSNSRNTVAVRMGFN